MSWSRFESLRASMWKGTFDPFRKVVDRYSFLALPQMTKDDWRWLDWQGLNPTAKNRIAEAVFAQDLLGFFDIRVINKARAKPRYLWPATRRLIREVDGEDHQFFSNSVRGVDEISTEAEFIDTASRRIGIGGRSLIKSLIRRALTTAALTAIREIHEEWETAEDIAKYLDALYLADASVAIVIILMYYYSEAELSSILAALEG